MMSDTPVENMTRFDIGKRVILILKLRVTGHKKRKSEVDW